MALIELVRWPTDSNRRTALEKAGRPRILVLDASVSPPICSLLEDWIRPPISREDLEARAATLQGRASALPTLSDGVLEIGGYTAPLTAGEARLVGVLMERFGRVLDREVLVRRLWPDGRTPRRNALDLRVLRLRRRLEPLGLTVRTVWRRGYLLEHTNTRREVAFRT